MSAITQNGFLSNLIPQSEFIKLTGWDRSTIWKSRKRGLPHYLVNGRVFFDVDEVEQWVLRKSRISKSTKKSIAGRK